MTFVRSPLRPSGCHINMHESIRTYLAWLKLHLDVFDFSKECKICHWCVCCSQLLLPGNGSSGLYFGKCTNISQINILFKAWGYLLWEINQPLSEALNKPLEQTSPQRIKNPSSVPPWPLISSDSNQATDSSMIIIHVVNHLLLQKNCFPCCPTLLRSQTQMLRSNNGGLDCHCCGGIMVTVNTIFCNFRLVKMCFLVSCSGKWHIYFIQQ